jgi:hypothetical protein
LGGGGEGGGEGDSGVQYLQQLIKEVVACFGTLYFATNDEIEGGYMTEIARRVQTSLSHALR